MIGKEIKIWEFCHRRPHDNGKVRRLFLTRPPEALRSRIVTHMLPSARQMALTRAFRETIYRRAQQDGAFRKALLTEAVNAYLGGDEVTGKAVLRDVIKATLGFEQLAAELQKPSKSLHRMLGPGGNPNTANFFAILQVLQKRVGVKLTVKAA